MTQNALFCFHSLLQRSLLFLFLTFVICHAGILSSFSILHPLPLSQLAFSLLEAMGTNLCTRLQRLNEFIPFPARWSWWSSWRDPVHTLSRRLVGFDNGSVFCLALLFNAAGLPVLLASSFARHCSWHRNFQLSTRVFDDILEFLHQLDQWGKYHAIFLHCEASVFRQPTFAFLCVSTLPIFVSKSLATKCLVWRSFAFWLVSSQTRFFPSNTVNLVGTVHVSDNSRSPSTFQQSSMFFSGITSNDVLVALVTSMYFSGIGNAASLGTYS